MFILIRLRFGAPLNDACIVYFITRNQRFRHVHFDLRLLPLEERVHCGQVTALLMYWVSAKNFLDLLRMPVRVYCTRLGSLLLRSCDVFWAPVNSLVCWRCQEVSFQSALKDCQLLAQLLTSHRIYMHRYNFPLHPGTVSVLRQYRNVVTG